MLSSEHVREMIKTMRSFRAHKFLCDILLVTEDGLEFSAHSVVLAAASSVFRNLFQPLGNSKTFHLAGFDGPTVNVALDVMYSGELNLPAVYCSDMVKFRQLYTSLKDLGLDEEVLRNCQIIYRR